MMLSQAHKPVLVFIVLLFAISSAAHAAGDGQTGFKRLPLKYIAALGHPDQKSGDGAETWGLWPVDPGPRGVRLKNFAALEASGGIAPAQWRFDRTDWWLEENGLIMEQPQFPLAPGKYIVTGNRRVISILTVHTPDTNGNQRWELADDASLHDVTHLGCRSARYTPVNGSDSCSPANAPRSAFRVKPGAAMPPVSGCYKQDYAVLFVLAVGVEN